MAAVPPFPPDSPTPEPTGGLDLAFGVAAPLLAGIAFTLIALVIQLPKRNLRWQDPALLLLVASGLSLITAVQAAMWERQYRFEQSGPRWRLYATLSYDTGILFLLAAVAVLLVPSGPLDRISWARRGSVALAGLGFLAELAWVSVSVFRDIRGRVRMARVRKRQRSQSHD